MSTTPLFSRSVCALLALTLPLSLSACSLKLTDGPEGVTFEVDSTESSSLSSLADRAMSSAEAALDEQSSTTLNKQDSNNKEQQTEHNSAPSSTPKNQKEENPAPASDETQAPADTEWYGELTPDDFTDRATIIGGVATINDSNVKIRIDEPVELLLIQGQNVKVIADHITGLVVNGENVDVLAKSYTVVTLNGMNSNVVWTSKDDPQIINTGSNNTYRGPR